MAYVHNQISVITKTYDLYKLQYQYSKAFPKSDKYSLGEKIKSIILEILELLMEAETAKKDWKKSFLEKASVKLGLLKILIRLSNDIKILDNKKYLELEEKIIEIGKMIGGWMKMCK